MKRLKTIAFSINHQRIRSCEDKRKSRLRKVHQIRRTNTLTGQSNLHSCIFTRLSSETGRGWFACEQDATTRSNMIEDATKKKKKEKMWMHVLKCITRCILYEYVCVGSNIAYGHTIRASYGRKMSQQWLLQYFIGLKPASHLHQQKTRWLSRIFSAG